MTPWFNLGTLYESGAEGLGQGGHLLVHRAAGGRGPVPILGRSIDEPAELRRADAATAEPTPAAVAPASCTSDRHIRPWPHANWSGRILALAAGGLLAAPRARRQEQFSKVETIRHSYEAGAAARRGEHDQAKLHNDAARSWTALGQRAALVRDMLGAAHDTRCQWEVMTEPTRRMARAADIELKRRGALGPDEHLKSAEPEGFKYPDGTNAAEVWVQPRLDGTVELPREPEPLSPDQREQRALDVLGLTPGSYQAELPVQVNEIADYNRKRQAEIDERRTMRVPAEEPDEMDLGEAWNVLAERRRDAVIQPPKPPIPAAHAVLERAAEREAEA
jgi:hypothetical protein